MQMQARFAEAWTVAVDVIADNRPAHGGGVNAQLMGPAGDRLEREPGEIRFSLPPCGGGAGRGVHTGTAAAVHPSPERCAVDLPHKGGGNKEERRFALSSTSVGKNPASVLPAPVGAISSAERSSRAFASSAS